MPSATVPKRSSLRGALALSIWVLFAAGPAEAATVISVGDGDTLRVLDGVQKVTISLACIDAPEMAQAPYGALLPLRPAFTTSRIALITS